MNDGHFINIEQKHTHTKLIQIETQVRQKKIWIFKGKNVFFLNKIKHNKQQQQQALHTHNTHTLLCCTQ